MTIERREITSREEWLSWRAGDLTASDFGAAVGLDRKTPLELYGEKTGLLMPDADSNIMRRGRWMEPAVLAALREKKPLWEVQKCIEYLRDPELRIGATPDAVAITEDGEVLNVQCKVVARPTYERDWSDGPPMPYVLQTLCEGMLAGMNSTIAALVVDTYSADLYLHPVPRHHGAEQRLRAVAAEFWANVAAGRRPAADYQRDVDVLAALYPQSVAEPVLDLTGDNMLPNLLNDRAHLKDYIADAEKRVKAIDTEIKDKLGAAEKATLPGWKLSWKTTQRKETVTAAYSYRPLLVTDLRDKEEQAA